MPAPAGNLNAEKWTTDHTLYLIDEIEDLIDQDNIHYLGQALGICNAYAELWSRLKKKWKDHDEIIHRMRVIEQRFEAKMVAGHMCGRYKGNSVKLVLQRYHDYEKPAPKSDRKKQEITEEMIEEIEAETGPLSESMKTSATSRKLLLNIYGMTKEEMLDAGYNIEDGEIYPPDHPYIHLGDDKYIAL